MYLVVNKLIGDTKIENAKKKTDNNFEAAAPH